jgi:TolB protein
MCNSRVRPFIYLDLRFAKNILNRSSRGTQLAEVIAATFIALAQVMPAALAMPVTYSANYDPTLSPDGKRMIFIKLLEGREQLFEADVDGRNEHQITRDRADKEDPAWSPDGKRLAYVLIGPKNSLHVMNVDGSGDEALSPANQSPIHPEWTADGRAILYCTDDDLHPPQKNAAEIYRLNLATGRIDTVISGGVNTYPVPSPDGTRIAFRKMLGTNSEVFVANRDGSGITNLTNNPAFEGWPAWSPDGRRIAFAGNRNGVYQVFVMNADGADVRLVANTEGRATAPKWAPDGKSIYFTNCWRTGRSGACEIFVAAAP